MDLPDENREEPEDDFRFRMLVDELAKFHAPTDEAVHLHRWLCDRVSQQELEQSIERGIDKQPRAEQIATCKKLEAWASSVSAQFDFLQQLSALEFELARAYREVVQAEIESRRPLKSGTHEEWLSFRDRLQADAELLATIAKQTAAELEARGPNRGRRALAWRNGLITDLFDRLPKVASKSRKLRGDSTDERNILAQAVWNIYFPDADIRTEEAATKTTQRERKKRIDQGH